MLLPLGVGLLVVSLLLLASVFVIGGSLGAAAGELSALLMTPALGFLLTGAGLRSARAWLRWLLLIPGGLLLLASLGLLFGQLMP